VCSVYLAETSLPNAREQWGVYAGKEFVLGDRLVRCVAEVYKFCFGVMKNVYSDVYVFEAFLFTNESRVLLFFFFFFS